jgi:hypothetical protein
MIDGEQLTVLVEDGQVNPSGIRCEVALSTLPCASPGSCACGGHVLIIIDVGLQGERSLAIPVGSVPAIAGQIEALAARLRGQVA